MKTTNVARYALRLSLAQVNEMSAADKVVSRSAFMLAAIGIGMSSFSLKQMLNSSNKETARNKV